MNAVTRRSAAEIAAKAWGTDLPDWVIALAEACDLSSQGKVAARLGKSGATVSLVLNRSYPASLSGLEQIVRGRLMQETIPCPVIGDIARDQCHQNQKNSGTAQERQLFGRACETCQHRRGK